MATALTVRTLDGISTELAIDGHHFASPNAVTIDRELDTAALWALPGLADCHAHLSGSSVDDRPGDDELLAVVRTHAWAQLENGVFLVADKGTHSDLTLEILDEPPTKRPDLDMAGRVITSPSGYYPDFAIEVDESDIAEVVRAQTRGANSWIKFIGDWPKKGVGATPNFSEEGFARAVEIAHEGGCRVAIHAAAPDTSTIAVRAGIDSIEHGLFLTAEDLDMLGARRGAWVPTIDAMQAIADMLGGESSGGKLFAEGLRNVRDILGGAVGAGVAVLAGTDLHLPHGGVAGEALKLAEYGMDNDAVIHAMTTAAYDYLGHARGFEPGLPADVIFFDRDPREDLTVLQHPTMCIRHGLVL